MKVLRSACREAAVRGQSFFQNHLDTLGGNAPTKPVADVIAMLPALIERESKRGAHHAIVTAVDSNDWKSGLGIMTEYEYKLAMLTGSSREIYDACHVAGLRPTLEFWCNGSENSGHYIVIHW